MTNIYMYLVMYDNPDEFDEFKRLYQTHQQVINKLNRIILTASTNAQMKFPSEIQLLSFTYVDNYIESQLEINDTIVYKEFILSKPILHEMIRVHIIDYMKDGMLPEPQSVVFGKCLEKAVVRGFLPKRFSANIMNFKFRYDSGIDGVIFL